MGSLENLCAVRGVRGAAIFDHDGSCLESRLQAPYDPEFVGEILQGALRGLEALEPLDGEPSRAAFARAEHGCLGVLRTTRYAIVTLTEVHVDPKHLWVAFGALEARLSRESERPRSASFVSSSDLPTPAALVPDEVMQAVESALSQEVGPIARVLIMDELNALGATSASITEAQLPELVQRLERTIERATQRRSFREAVTPLLALS